MIKLVGPDGVIHFTEKEILRLVRSTGLKSKKRRHVLKRFKKALTKAIDNFPEGSKMSKKTLSYSGWKRYMTCPKMYEYHYEQRIRPLGQGSALWFGVAIDSALNHMLINKDLEAAVQIFRDNFIFENMEDTYYEPRDFDARLLKDSDIGVNFEYNAWKSMRVKGRILLEGYYNEILPLVEEVHSVQKELDSRSGFIDCIVTLRGHGKVLLDNKTSARPYAPDAVVNDTQLALYCADQGLTKAAFAVMIKEIDCQTIRTCTVCKYDGSNVKHKTCPNIINGSRCFGTWDEKYQPRARIQLLVDDVPQINKDNIQNSISQVETAIENKIFPMNLGACGKMYGKPCSYINKCWRGDDSGLRYVEETKEKK